MSTDLDVSVAYPFRPKTDYPPLQGFWDATREGRLAFPWCADCDRWSWYPGWGCPGCGMELTWRTVEPRALVTAWTTVEHAFHPDFRGVVPFRVALVEPEETTEVRLVIRLDDSAGQVDVGDAVVVDFIALSDDVRLPVARPA